MEKIFSILSWAVSTFAPQYRIYFDAAMTLIKGAKALADKLGIRPSDAFKRVSEIQLGIRPADATEKAALRAGGLIEADESHDFPYTMQ